MNHRYFDTDNSATPLIPQRVLFGRSTAMREVRQSVEGVADTSVPVLILGERGTGKEVIAREIHRLSPLRSAPFIRLPNGERIEPFLKDRARGLGRAFSSSSGDSTVSPNNSGCILFIEEISELAASVQAKLLEFFHEGSMGHTNGETSYFENARVICASSRNLENDVTLGNFRLDLFYRINVVTITLPSLRNRKEDIPDLAEYFFESCCRQRGRHCARLTPDVLQLLREHDWPGNIRELKNCISSYVSSGGDPAVIEALIGNVRAAAQNHRWDKPENPISLRVYTQQLVKQAEKDLILKVLREQRWNRKETAKVLKVSYQTLLHKLKQTGLNRKRWKESSTVDDQLLESRLP